MYNPQGVFSCGENTAQHDFAYTGEFHTERKTIEKVLPNGDKLVTTFATHKKVTKNREDLICKCGKPMTFLGYRVWVEKLIDEGKSTSIGSFGTINVGRRTEVDSVRYFQSKTKMMEYIKATLDKQANKAKC